MEAVIPPKSARSVRATEIEGRRKRLAVVILFALCLPLLPACAVSANSANADGLVINEVMSSNRYTLMEETLGTPDWIELYNGTDEDIDLEGYGLTNNAKKIRKFTFPDVVLGAGEYLIVYACDAEEETSGDALVTGFSISKDGEYLILTDAYAGLVQQLEVPELAGDVSYARSSSGDYGYTLSPTPGAANDDGTLCASLADLSNAGSGALVLSELVPYPTSGDAWAELYNASESAIQLNGYYLSDRAAEPLRERLPDYLLEPGCYVLVYFAGEDSEAADELSVDFAIGANDTLLTLSDADGTLQNALSWEADFPADLSVIEAADGCCCAVSTPLAANPEDAWRIGEPSAMDDSDPVVISEIMPENDELFPDSLGNCSGWVELHNRSDEAVSLLGYYLSDDPDAPFRYALSDEALEAGGYRVVYLSDAEGTGGELYAGFRLSAGETLLLTQIDGMRQDSYAYDGTCPDNASFGRDESGSVVYYGTPTPGYENAKSYALPDQLGWFDSGGIYISEVCAASDEDENDWIELCNGSDSERSLDGWYLSDDPADPMKYCISGVTIPADGYAVIEASSDANEEETDVASFGITASGETILLSEPSGRTCDIFRTGALRADVTSGRIASDETVGRVFFNMPTRGAENTAVSASGYAAEPSFSCAELYHDEAFSLTISCTTENAVIRYTTDGSLPDEESTQYDGAIEISDTTVIRAAAFCDGLLESNDASATYLFTEPHTVPVVCVAADPDELLEVLKTTSRENKPECRADFTYYDDSGALSASFCAGIRAKGRSMLKYTQKSFSVKLRGIYGQSSVSFPFFDDSDIVTYSAFSLRNGGQDRGRSRLRDSYFSRLAEGLNIENFKTRVVALYLNGEYYGVFDLNEEQDESYLASHYGADENAVDIVNRNDEAKEGSAEEFLRVREFARTQDLSNDEVFAQFAEWVDVDYFTDYLVFRSYIADSDMINQTYWRAQDYSIKWRPVLFDLDYGLYGNDYQQEYKKDILGRYFDEDGVPSADGSLTNMDIYVGLKKNAAWRRKFVARYIELMHTTLSPEHMLALLDEMDDVYLAELPRQIAAIGFPPYIGYTETWLEQLRTGIMERPAYALKYLKKNFPEEADYIDELESQYN